MSHSRAMQARAQQSGCDVVVGLMGESALGTLAGLQFAASIVTPVLPSVLTWFLAMTEQVLKTANGMLVLPSEPSLASLVDWDAVAKAH